MVYAALHWKKGYPTKTIESCRSKQQEHAVKSIKLKKENEDDPHKPKSIFPWYFLGLPWRMDYLPKNSQMVSEVFAFISFWTKKILYISYVIYATFLAGCFRWSHLDCLTFMLNRVVDRLLGLDWLSDLWITIEVGRLSQINCKSRKGLQILLRHETDAIEVSDAWRRCP